MTRTDVVGGLVVLGVLLATLAVGAAYAGLQVFGPVPLDELEVGACLRSRDVMTADPEVDDLWPARCEVPHDAQVVGVVELTAQDAEVWDGARASELCAAALEPGLSLSDLAADDIEVRPLAGAPDPRSGDTVACLARDATGDQLVGLLATGPGPTLG